MSAWVLLALLGGCDRSTPPGASEPVAGSAPEAVPLAPTDQLLRVAMALRGVRPTVDELARVQEDPAALEALVDEYLDSPEFGLTVRDLHAESLLLRGVYPVLPAIDVLAGRTQGEIARTLWEAPLRLVEDVVMRELPYTEILTADYTMATGLMEQALWVERRSANLPDDAWGRANWTDGRPAAGLLASSGLWLQHLSAGENHHRGRANLLSRALLCTDFLDRDVTITGSVDLADADEVAQAVQDDPACAGCHQALDPLAAFLWGFREPDMFHRANRSYERDADDQLVLYDDGAPRCLPNDALDAEGLDPFGDCFPLVHYVPEYEGRWELAGLRPPGYFGTLHGEQLGLDDLGRAIADDPRFSLCTARRVAGYLGQLEPENVPFEVAAALQADFVDSGFDLKALARQVVLSDAFLTAQPAGADDFVYGLQTLRPEQAARVMAQLTGFVWEVAPDPEDCGEACWGTVDMVTSGGYGLRQLMGGIDADTRSRPTLTPTPVATLALGRLAAEAAAEVVSYDYARRLPSERRLLQDIALEDTSEDAVRDQLVALHLRILGEVVVADDPAVDAALALFEAGLAESGATADGWLLVLTVLLQDVRMAFY